MLRVFVPPPPPPKAVAVALAFVERILETQRNASDALTPTRGAKSLE
jgi:hypothetical protein